MIQQSLGTLKRDAPLLRSSMKNERFSDLTTDLLALASSPVERQKKQVVFAQPLVTAAHSISDYLRLQTIRKLREIGSVGETLEVENLDGEDGQHEVRSSLDSMDSGHFELEQEAVFVKPRHLETVVAEGVPLLKTLLIARHKEDQLKLNGQDSAQTFDSADIEWEDSSESDLPASNLIVDDCHSESKNCMILVDVDEVSAESSDSVGSSLQSLPKEGPKGLRRSLKFIRVDKKGAEAKEDMQPHFVMIQPNDSKSSISSDVSVALGRKTRSSIDIFRFRSFFSSLIRRDLTPRSSMDRSSSPFHNSFSVFRNTSMKSVESKDLKETVKDSAVTILSEDTSDMMNIPKQTPRRSIDSSLFRRFFKKKDYDLSNSVSSSPSSSVAESDAKKKPFRSIRKFFSKIFQ
jgi:hypothetical protein